MSKFHRTPSFSPLMLRLALGAVFLNAGIAKLVIVEHIGPTATKLEHWGVGRVITPSTAPVAESDADRADEATETESADDDRPAGDAPDLTDPTTVTPEAPSADADPATDAPGDSATPVDSDDAISAERDPAASEAPMIDAKVEARGVEGLAVMLTDSAEGNDERARLIPASMGSSSWARGLAWAAAITETAAGALMIFGLFTRLGALGLMWIMGVAMWLTQIGPVVMSRVAGTGIWGFLPEWLPPGLGWSGMLTQFSLFMVAFALLLLGPGRMSLDAWVFGTREPRPPKGRSPSPSRYDEPASRPRRPDHPGEISLD